MNPDHRPQSKPLEAAEPAAVLESQRAAPEPAAAPESTKPVPTDGIPWMRLAAAVVPLVGLTAGAVGVVSSRRRAALEARRRMQLGGIAVMGTFVALALATRARWKGRKAARETDLEEDPPLFV